MAQNTGIEWTDATWNPLAGCKEVSPGCTNCYAAVMAHRLEAMGQDKYKGTTRKLANGKVVWTGKISLAGDDDAVLTEPLRRKKPTRYFVNSMSDLFHEDVPDEFIDKVFAVMAMASEHTFQVLTKRPERMRDYLLSVQSDDKDMQRWARFSWLAGSPCASNLFDECDWPLPNVWLGVSVEDQQRADERIPLLLQTPAAVSFLSMEPLLGPVDIRRWVEYQNTGHILEDCIKLGWVIVGGESGPNARPMHPDWARSIRDQCQEAGVPFFFKQWGEWAECDPSDEDVAREPDKFVRWSTAALPQKRVGKKAAGRLLDGREWNEYPTNPHRPA